MKKFIDCYIPTETCNLRCHYCYITQKRKFNNKVAKFNKSSKEIREALSKERLGGECLFNFCAGGETLLIEEIIDITKELLEEGHYIMIVTNGTLSKRFDEIVKLPKELLKKLFFKFSFHYLELKRLNQMEEYFKNIKKIKDVGCSYTVELTPSDEIIKEINNIKKICLDNVEAECHITIARDDRTSEINILSEKSYEDYKDIWGAFNSSFFDFKTAIFYKKRTEFCYAGDWSYYLNLVTGDLKQCYCGENIDNIYTNINLPLKQKPIGNGCTLPHCYNGHAFLTLGTIPELETPNYSQMRNRITSNDEEWLSKVMKDFMSKKLKDSNLEYTEKEKKKINFDNKINKMKKMPRKALLRLKYRIFSNEE